MRYSTPGPEGRSRGTEITGIDVGGATVGGVLCCGRAETANPITPAVTATTARAGTNLVIVSYAIRRPRRCPLAPAPLSRRLRSRAASHHATADGDQVFTIIQGRLPSCVVGGSTRRVK